MTYAKTADLDERFMPRLKEVCADVGADPRSMLSVLFSESGVYATAHNDNPKNLPPEKRYNASGIGQMMPATLQGLGWARGHAAFRALSATDQLEWVGRYFRPHRGRVGTIGAIYTANFLPVLVVHASDPDFVLCAHGGVYGWAYGPNAVFDANGDARITVRELEAAVVRNCSGPRWAELLWRLDGELVSPVLEHFDLGTTQGLQNGLDRLGYDVGVVDGIPGPRTRAALLLFQQQRGLKADGIYGPRSRAALQIALDTAA